MGNNYFLLGALVTPLVGAIVALVFARSNRIQRIIGVVAGIIAWLFCSALLIEIHSSGIQTYALGNWRPPYGIVLVGLALIYGAHRYHLRRLRDRYHTMLAA